MVLTKDDLSQIKKIVDDSVGTVEVDLGKKIDKGVEQLAIITKRGFDDNDAAHKKLFKGQQQIIKEISNLEFIATEMVRRDELLEVKQRLTKIEAKLGIAK